MKKIEGYGIWHRGAIKPLLDSLEHRKHASELEVYFYLMFHANCTYKPRPVPKGNFFVLEGRGQVAISVEDLSSYFKVARNTISNRLKSLEKSGCIKTIQNARICNVYEIVSYGETVYEPCKKMALSNLLSNRAMKTSRIFEQPQKYIYIVLQTFFLIVLSNLLSNRAMKFCLKIEQHYK